jgi:hypothetical protein
MLKRGRILTEDEARAKVRLWNNKAIHREAEENDRGRRRKAPVSAFGAALADRSNARAYPSKAR